MATKTIPLDIEAYERLRSTRISERESFSNVIKRANWVATAGTAGDLLAWSEEPLKNNLPNAASIFAWLLR